VEIIRQSFVRIRHSDVEIRTLTKDGSIHDLELQQQSSGGGMEFSRGRNISSTVCHVTRFSRERNFGACFSPNSK